MNNGSTVNMGAADMPKVVSESGAKFQQLGELKNARRHVPKNRQGLNDEWSALIALQNEAMVRREQSEKQHESMKKRQYLEEL